MIQAAPPPAAVQPGLNPAYRAHPAEIAAGGAFMMGCFSALNKAASAADYVAKVEALRSEMPIPSPGAASRAELEGVDGRTCRVTYVGPFAAKLFSFFSDFRAEHSFAVCTDGARTPTHASTSCAPGTAPGIEVVVDQQGEENDARLVGSVTFISPATKPTDARGFPLSPER